MLITFYSARSGGAQMVVGSDGGGERGLTLKDGPCGKLFTFQIHALKGRDSTRLKRRFRINVPD